MSVRIDREEIGQLSPPERLALIEQLWDSLEDHEVPLTAVQAEELDRRLASLAQDPQDTVPWSALKSEMERRCP
jgi:putative addiction module component (TIGR02574 family)